MSSTRLHDIHLPYFNDKVILLNLVAHEEGFTVEELVLKYTDWVGITDGGLEQSLGILCRVWSDDLQAGNGAVPRRVVLRVLSGHTLGEAVGSTECDVAWLDTTGHVVCLGGRVDDLVNGLHGKVEGHELADGVQTSERSTNS